MWIEVATDFMAAVILSLLLYHDCRVPASDFVAASDASEAGGCVVRSDGITIHGIRRVLHPGNMVVNFVASERLVLASAFDGVGGARRAAELLGLAVGLFVAMEIDPSAKRAVQHMYLDVIEHGGHHDSVN